MPKLTIKGQVFDVADDPTVTVGAPMSEGHVHSLQQTRRENIRNNFSSKVANVLGDAESLSEEQHNELQTALSAYAESYQFGARTAGGGGGRPARDPVEREMHRMAREDIANAYFAKYGEKPTSDFLSENVGKLLEAKGDEYARRARRAIKEREAAAQTVLEGLGIAA